jgi:multidrug resistance efflux pump
MANINEQIRRLSSIEERMAALKETGAKVRATIEKDMRASGDNKVETIYGYTQLKNTVTYDYSSFPEVAQAELALEQAKAALKAAQAQAQAAGAPKAKGKVFAFVRNKAVSARAKKGRIYVSTITTGNQVPRMMRKAKFTKAVNV